MDLWTFSNIVSSIIIINSLTLSYETPKQQATVKLCMNGMFWAPGTSDLVWLVDCISRVGQRLKEQVD